MVPAVLKAGQENTPSKAIVTFFGAAFFIFLVFLRPVTLTSVYFLAVIVNPAGFLAIALYETVKTMRRI